MLLSKLSLSWKIALPAMVVFLLAMGLSAINLTGQWNTMLSERMASLKHITTSAKTIAERFHDKETAGEMTREEAQAAAKAAIDAMRYDNGTGYIFVYDWDGTNLVLPNASLVGTNLWDMQDKAGNYLVRELIGLAKSGGGQHIYFWTKPGSDALFEKYSWAEGMPEWQWMLGTGVYVDDLEAAFLEQAIIVLVISCVGLVIAGVLALQIIRSINTPISALIGNMGELAQGNSTIKVEGTERVDEVGKMARAMQIFVDNEQARKGLMQDQQRQQEDALKRGQDVQALCASFDKDVAELLAIVTNAAHDLQDASTGMREAAQNTSSRSVQVSEASRQASSNVEAVASAAEELAASVSEVSRQVQTSNDMALQASTEASATNERVERLAQSAKQISDVVSLIQAIAEQTNLLALNATIEAARAGEAGKGFAVVAAEVKELASQTSKATEEIDHQISTIQSETNQTVSAISTISETVRSLSGISAEIAAAVDQQRSATDEIANNVTQASRVTQQVSDNIGTVTDAARSTGSTAEVVSQSSVELQHKADQLRDLVNKFLGEVKLKSAANG